MEVNQEKPNKPKPLKIILILLLFIAIPIAVFLAVTFMFTLLKNNIDPSKFAPNNQTPKIEFVTH